MSTLERLKKVGNKLRTEPVEFDGETFFVRNLTGAERHEMLVTRAALEKNGDALSDAHWAAIGLCEEDGTPVFTDDDGATVLGGFDGALVTKLALATLRISGLTEETANPKG